MKIVWLFIGMILVTGCTSGNKKTTPVHFSGIYPHIAFYNNEDECGTGALVPWADRLWVISYGPHLPFGSTDKLYEIRPDLERIVHPESVGGTPANRMIHKESGQLFIGPYIVDESRNVRVIQPEGMPGRLTGNARHLINPEVLIYYATMEEGFYEANVRTLEVKCLFKDSNVNTGIDLFSNSPLALLPGAHGKGLYSGQGVIVYSNNGELSDQATTRFDIESGSLNEWNGAEWKLIRRDQFVEVTGPGGIYGNSDPVSDPVWVTGFDHKSLLAGVRDNGSWSFYRLPKASHSYDGAHGWNTEWPRIRDVGTEGNPFFLMTMHGMFWSFPGTFSSTNSAGIRPISAYLKVIGDFTSWNDSLVFGCDDSAYKEFLNKRRIKGNITGPGQSNSNLWFTSLKSLSRLGPCTADGAIWISENIEENERSEPFLFAGWETRTSWIKNEGETNVIFTLEADSDGRNNWAAFKSVPVKPGESVNMSFDDDQKGEWIRISADRPTRATVHFWYTGKDARSAVPDNIFTGLAGINESSSSAGLLWGLGNNRRKLGILAGTVTNDQFTESGYYELDSLMNLIRKDDPETAGYIRDNMAIPQNVLCIDSASVLIIDDQGRRWRLPKGNPDFKVLTDRSLLRICREVATERDLFNCSGTFYELPAENADGFAKIRPVASHNFRIYDYASYRGMLIMTGLKKNIPEDNPHVITSGDGMISVWAGALDDLWKAGKPVGEGGPWYNSPVKAGVPSDAYLIGFYDKRTLSIRHNSPDKVGFIIEADPVGTGKWMIYKKIIISKDDKYNLTFPDSFQARWIRFITDRDCSATTILKYE